MEFFKFPTTAIVVDDDFFVQQTITEDLNSIGFFAKGFGSVLNLQSISPQSYQEIKSMFQSVSQDHYNKNTKFIRISSNDVHKLLYTNKRFTLISIIIVDYHLPGINGFEFLKSIDKSLPIKKILITGDLKSETLAIEAFNTGIIDGFVNKLDIGKLQNIASDLANQFFRDFSKDIFGSTTFGSDEKLSNFISEFLESENIKEYYLCDHLSFLCLTDSGIKEFFIVSEIEIVKFLMFMKEENLNPNIYQNIYERKSIPIINGKLNFKESIQLLPCKKFEGSNNIYYYAYADNKKLFDINYKKIIFSDNYRKIHHK